MHHQIHKVDVDIIETVAAFAYLWGCCSRGLSHTPLPSSGAICHTQPEPGDSIDGAADKLMDQIESEVQAGVQSEVQVGAQSEVQAGAQTDLQEPQSLADSHSLADVQSLVDIQSQQETQLLVGSQVQNCEVTFELTNLVKRSQVTAISLVAFSEDGCGKEGVEGWVLKCGGWVLKCGVWSGGR